MQKVLDRRDTFVVSTTNTPKGGEPPTKTVTLPSGQRVHSLDRSVFDRAIKAATKALRDRDRP